MAKDHGSSVKNDKQYEGLRKKGMSKERAAKISNTSGASKKGGKKQTGGSGGGTKEGQRKGGRPVISSYKIAPSAYTSLAGPTSFDLPAACSGDM